MRLGSIQRNIVAYLSRCGESGGPICSTTKAEEFRGLDLEQVERALAGLLKRGIVRRERICYVLAHYEAPPTMFKVTEMLRIDDEAAP